MMDRDIRRLEDAIEASNVLLIANTALQLKARHDVAWNAYRESKTEENLFSILGAIEWFFIYKEELSKGDYMPSIVMNELEQEMMTPLKNFSEDRRDYIIELVSKSRRSNPKHLEYLAKELLKIGYVL